MANIKDVAKSAGVSVSTVSKVLNDSHEISDATKALVNEHIKLLNYHPNASARNLARKKTKNIIYMTNLEKGAAFSNPHSFEMVCGIYNYLEKKGYTLRIVGPSSVKKRIGILTEIINEKQADGVIIHSSAFSKKFEPLLKNSNFPHIIIGKPENCPSINWMDINHIYFSEFAAQYLIDKGHSRIAYLGGSKNDKISEHRFLGVKNRIDKENKQLILPNTKEEPNTYDECIQLFENKVKPTAIICANNKVALDALKAIKRLNLSIPHDVALLTFDEYPYAEVTEPKLSSVDVDVYELGKECAVHILRLIKNPTLLVEFSSTIPVINEKETT